jgi:hypothetical protein
VTREATTAARIVGTKRSPIRFDTPVRREARLDASSSGRRASRRRRLGDRRRAPLGSSRHAFRACAAKKRLGNGVVDARPTAPIDCAIPVS